MTRVLLAFVSRDLRLALSYPLELALSLGRVVFPLLVLYLPAQLIGDMPSARSYGGFLPFSVVGMALMSFFSACHGSLASAVRAEQNMGTLEALLMTPVSLPVFLLGAAAWGFLWATFTALVFLAGGALLYGFSLHGEPWLVLGLIGLTALIFVALGVLSASFVMVYKRGDPVGALLSITFFLLGGVIYPPAVLPAWLRWASAALPMTHAGRALREVLLAGKGFSAIASDAAALAIYALALVPLSLWLFSAAVRRAKRDGTLLHY